jgi:hypothetical protein
MRALRRAAFIIAMVAHPCAALAQTATDTPGVTATATETRTETATATPPPSPTRTATSTRTATATISGTPTRTGTPTPTHTRTATHTPPSTPTRTASMTRTPTHTRTGTATRTPTRSGTPTRTETRSRTATGTRTAVPTRTTTGTITATGTVTRTATPVAAFVSVDLIADRRGDNNDGTFTTVVSALVSDQLGNPVGDGVTVVFSLSPPVPGVTITQTGKTNQPPDCDVSSYVADTGRPVNPQPGIALTCLNYVQSSQGQRIAVRAQVAGPNGVIETLRDIRLPTSPTPSPTASDSPTAPSTATATGTVTNTGTVTATPTDAPTGTPTETPLAPIRVAALGGSARPGSEAGIRFDLADAQGRVHDLTFDILIDSPVFDPFLVAMRCRLDPTLTTHQLSATLQLDPFVPAGKRRFRYVLSDAQNRPVRPGRLINCAMPVADDAPLGPSELILDRVLGGDENGELIPGILPVNGALFIDPDAPLATATGTATSTPTITHTSTATATRTATTTATETPTRTATPTGTATDTDTPTPTETPTPIPTATPTVTPTPSPSTTPTPTAVPCTGDCDRNGTVSINELILAVNVSSGAAQASVCSAADRNGSDTVTIDELIAAVGNALDGCDT